MTETPEDVEKPEAIENLETIDAALGDLEENGTDADSDELAESGDILGELIETAEESGEDEGEAYEMLTDGQDAVETVVAGDATEDDVQTAGGALATVGKQLQMAMLEQMLGGAQ